jgi:hypothetical protein
LPTQEKGTNLGCVFWCLSCSTEQGGHFIRVSYFRVL